MNQVTDPELLKLLNASNSETKPLPNQVTDPTLLTQLNGEPSYLDQAVDFVTGRQETEYPDMPEISDMNGNGWTPDSLEAGGKISAGMLAAVEPQMQMDIIRKHAPYVNFRKDKYGNPILVDSRDGKEFYLNKPGLSAQDINQTVAQGLTYFGSLNPVTRGVTSLGKRAVVSGATSAATSAGLDKTSEALGSEQGINLNRAALAGVFGSGFEYAGPLLGKIGDLFKRGLPEYEIITTAKNDLLKAGYKPQDLTDGMVNEFVALAKKSANPSQTARMAEANSLPVKVPTTRGDITQKPKDQMFESLAEKGAYGDAPQTTMAGIRARQQDALRGNLDAIGQSMGGNVQEAGQGAQMAQNKLVEKAGDLKGLIADAYTTARKAPAAVASKRIPQLAQNLKESAGAKYRHSSMAQKEIEELLALGSGDQSVLVESLHQWRRNVSSLANSTTDQVEASALRDLVKSFDKQTLQMAKEGLMEGNEAAAKLWMRAINKRKGFGKLYEGNDIIEDLVATEMRGGKRQLKVAPEDAANYIFGASNIGFINKRNLARDLLRMRSVLGSKSQEWAALREEAFLRIARAGEGGHNGGTRQFSGVKFKKAWEDVQSKNQQFINGMFSPEERKLITQFANTAARVTGKVKGGDNPSNTSVGLSNIVQKIGSRLLLGEKGRAWLSMIPGPGYSIVQMVRGSKAATGSLPNKLPKAGVFGALGATGSSRF